MVVYQDSSKASSSSQDVVSIFFYYARSNSQFSSEIKEEAERAIGVVLI